jgi:hypothetical protein
MAMAEFWFDDVMKRKYLTTVIFDGNQSMMGADSSTDPNSWSDIDDVSRSSESWKSLDLPDVEDMFQARVLRSGTVCAQVPIPFKVSLTQVASNRPLSSYYGDPIWGNSCRQ